MQTFLFTRFFSVREVLGCLGARNTPLIAVLTNFSHKKLCMLPRFILPERRKNCLVIKRSLNNKIIIYRNCHRNRSVLPNFAKINDRLTRALLGRNNKRSWQIMYFHGWTVIIDFRVCEEWGPFAPPVATRTLIHVSSLLPANRVVFYKISVLLFRGQLLLL